jgi:predicted nucleotidyltransferase
MLTIADLPLKAKDEQAIAKAIELLRRHFPVEQVLLYGSKATGEDTEESDLDLLVLTSRKLSWQERDALTDALFDVELAYDVVISTLVVPLVEWQTGYYSVLPIYADGLC